MTRVLAIRRGNTAIGVSPGSAMQRLQHGLGVGFGDAEEDAGGAV